MVKFNKKYKVIRRSIVSVSKYGKTKDIVKGLGRHEKSTIKLLSKFGFDVEAITPSNIPKSKNPDILMMGTFWEMKGPRVANEETITTKFRKAVKQANGKAVFDLRDAGRNKEEIKGIIIKLFEDIRGMRRILIIEDDKNLLDISKKKR